MFVFPKIKNKIIRFWSLKLENFKLKNIIIQKNIKKLSWEQERILGGEAKEW